jgi:dephospho-CoA kinase
MAIRVGITGGMGSGKSTVAAVFASLGMPVYQADEAAKRLMNENAQVREQLIKNFGKLVYKDGLLDRSFLAKAVFNDKEKLALLNAIVHPVTIQDGEDWMARQNSHYAIKEAAIIFETGSQRYLDYIIGVYAPLTLRLHRSMKRDGLNKEEVTARMDRQMDDDIKMKLCDAVIVNDDQQALIPQVMRLHAELLQLRKTVAQ